MKRYEVFSLDVWGNSKEGYEVNDIYNTGFFIESAEFPGFSYIVKILKKEGWLKKRYRYTSQYPYENFEVVEYKGMPLYQIRETESDINERYFTKFPYTRSAIIYRIHPSRIVKIQ